MQIFLYLSQQLPAGAENFRFQTLAHLCYDWVSTNDGGLNRSTHHLPCDRITRMSGVEGDTKESNITLKRWSDDLVFDPAAPKVTTMRGRQDTCRSIINAIGGVSVLGPEGGVRWRGQANIEWRLTSGATRAGITGVRLEEHERKMIDTARRIGVTDAQHAGDWEILARYRHNGAATRLIDITTDPFVALFMLCDDVAEKGTDDVDGVLIAVSRESLTPVNKPWVDGSYQEMLGKEPRAAMVITTPPIDPRIAAQRGEFMFSTSPLTEDEAPECELFPVRRPPAWTRKKLERAMGNEQLVSQKGPRQRAYPNLMGIRVPREVKSTLRSMLKAHFGFIRETIYPDWAGLSEGFTPSKLPTDRTSA